MKNKNNIYYESFLAFVKEDFWNLWDLSRIKEHNLQMRQRKCFKVQFWTHLNDSYQH